ncbi:MAG TPA: MarR family transcriptional regulator [Candidatus Limnocylindria bacterium]|nr:MarR family transcriptional regulator [Candidatus Limnocylindria bacterium]
MTDTTVAVADLILEELAPLISRAKRAWATRCAARGLSMTHVQVLAMLDAAGPQTMSRLAEGLGVSLPNATGIVSRMEERGVLERAHDPADRRRVMVRLTEAGHEFSRELGDLRRAQLTALIESLTPEQQENLLRAIRDVHAAILAQPVAWGTAEEGR